MRQEKTIYLAPHFHYITKNIERKKTLNILKLKVGICSLFSYFYRVHGQRLEQ